MKIAICGDSYAATPVYHCDNHWCELLRKKYSLNVSNLAVAGCSNGHIRLQIEEALNIKANWVVINSTTHSRLEIPLKENKKLKYNIRDFGHVKDLNKPMASFVLSALIQGNLHTEKINENKRVALEYYFMNLYNDSWKRQTDQWIISSGLWDLHNHGVNILYDPWFLDYQFEDSMPNWFKEKYYLKYEDSIISLMKNHTLPIDKDPGYHLDSKAQQIIANRIANKILGNIV